MFVTRLFFSGTLVFFRHAGCALEIFTLRSLLEWDRVIKLDSAGEDNGNTEQRGGMSCHWRSQRPITAGPLARRSPIRRYAGCNEACRCPVTAGSPSHVPLPSCNRGLHAKVRILRRKATGQRRSRRQLRHEWVAGHELVGGSSQQRRAIGHPRVGAASSSSVVGDEREVPTGVRARMRVDGRIL